MKMKAKFLAGLLGRVLVTLPVAGCFTSCELVREDLPECYVPIVEVRFIYDYNMEFANAFHNQVDCLSAYFFDEEGYLVAAETVTDTQILRDENYRMHPELPEGSYHVVAYGGMACENASFYHVRKMDIGTHISDIHVRLDRYVTEDESPDQMRRLHNHFYGAADFTVVATEDTFATVPMKRNTNTIQIALQNDNGGEIDCNDFIFEITDDNNDFDSENKLLESGKITYRPYNTENRSTGVDESQKEWYAALAQFNTSRLVLRNSQHKPYNTNTTLYIRKKEDGSTLVELPLINYMLMFKNDSGATVDNYYGTDGIYYMDDQEFLDRENSWHFVFFLKDNLWLKSHIIINDWEVRMNEVTPM